GGGDQLGREPPTRLEEVVLGDMEAVLDLIVRADRLDGVRLGADRLGDHCPHSMLPSSALDTNASPRERCPRMTSPLKPERGRNEEEELATRRTGSWTVSATGSMSPSRSLLDPLGGRDAIPGTGA